MLLKMAKFGSFLWPGHILRYWGYRTSTSELGGGDGDTTEPTIAVSSFALYTAEGRTSSHHSCISPITVGLPPGHSMSPVTTPSSKKRQSSLRDEEASCTHPMETAWLPGHSACQPSRRGLGKTAELLLKFGKENDSESRFFLLISACPGAPGLIENIICGTT